MNNFNTILNDDKILNYYDKIENSKEDIWWVHHNYQHVKNVANLCEKIGIGLGFDNNFIEEVKIAALLHDIGSVYGKKNHATRSYEMAKEYLLKQNIKLKNKEDVLEAIKIHTDDFTTKNIMACVLMLCDKLDIKDTRLTEHGKTIIGIRQWQYIKNVNLDIKKDYIKIELICSSKINEKEFRDFYSTQKLFKAIENFKRNINVEIDLTLNKEI